MPLFSHRSSAGSAPLPSFYSSKPLKPSKPISTFPSTRTPLPFLVFSLLCLFIGLAGTLFALSAIRRRQSLPVFICGKSEDTFRAFYSSSVSGKLGDDNNKGLVDRPKLLGFVGIQTGFESGERRSALRSTWFPSDPDGLLRLAFFKAAFKLFEADYYVKADDDIYLRPDRLATLLAKERSDSLTYIGCMKKGPVITDPKLK